MFDIYELDSPDDNYVNPSSVISEFLKKGKTEGKIRAILCYEKGWFTSIIGSIALKVVLPSELEQFEDKIIKSALKGDSIFIFSKSLPKEIINFYTQYGYLLSEKTNLFDEIELSGEILEFIQSMKWEDSVIFFAHDGYPAYILTRRTEP